jgi:hypothetical protein
MPFLLVLVAVTFMVVLFSTPVKAVNWQPVTTITGSDSKNSEEFHIYGSEWRIRWTYTPNGAEPSMTLFSFFVYPHGETNNYVEYISKSGSSSTSGTLSIHEGPKLYYVSILSANTPGYTLTVEYDADSEVSDSALAVIIFLTIGVPIILIIIISVIIRKRVKKRKTSPVMNPPPPPPP